MDFEQNLLIIQVLTLAPSFFRQINMVLNNRLHKMWPRTHILSSMKC